MKCINCLPSIIAIGTLLIIAFAVITDRDAKVVGLLVPVLTGVYVMNKASEDESEAQPKITKEPDNDK